MSRGLHTVVPVVRRAVLSLLMLAVMLPSAAFARTEYLCSVDRTVRSSCCCPPKATKEKRERSPISTMSGACCCDVSTIEPPTPPAIDTGSKANAVVAPPQMLVGLAPSAPIPSVVVTSVPQRALAPPLIDRSLFARRCALLL